ncbi:hypothetical protein [Dyadobacter sediminis]|uniref:DUF937 domain-containing protein n=1 Tax=Dyadobacter sediminis TaxID=1493691 RepID=A0A5R9KKR4_9BACT|nr:hypothetical protein [Dyadobacter sediminis]TLU96785.1 hypothetical protein FEM55_06580 [Dyadobacter sediminis]GGB85140.1 hypothetical protein GCM10011325_10910 [Dyadobacter sediminis]
MLDQLLGLIQQNSQQAIVQNPEVPNEHNEDVMHTLMGSITGGLQQQAQNGNISEISNLFSGSHGASGNALMNNPMVSSIASNAISAIMQKFGLSNQVAGGIVSSVLPGVLGGLIGKLGNNNSNSSGMDLGGLLGGLLGGSNHSNLGRDMADGKQSTDLTGMLGGLFGNK